MSHAPTLVHKRRAEIQQRLGELGQQVIAALRRSVECLRTQDKALAAQIIRDDRLINQERRLLEQECLVTLAAYEPAAGDLRVIAACMEMLSELERIGDYAADVAQIVERDLEPPLPDDLVGAILALAERAIAMLERTLKAFLDSSDESTLRAAVADEPQIDRDEEAFIAQVLERMRSDAGLAKNGTYLLWIMHHYERVADRATNLAERAIYAIAGYTPDLD